jgi:hypothetical protein
MRCCRNIAWRHSSFPYIIQEPLNHGFRGSCIILPALPKPGLPCHSRQTVKMCLIIRATFFFLCRDVFLMCTYFCACPSYDTKRHNQARDYRFNAALDGRGNRPRVGAQRRPESGSQGPRGRRWTYNPEWGVVLWHYFTAEPPKTSKLHNT